VIGQPSELYSEANDNSVAILLTYGMARVLFAGEAKVRKEKHSTERFVHAALHRG
jgi:beta-lactamase superfamily II metal-dependent hydrolase